MKYFKLLAGILTGVLVITFVAEIIEYVTIMLVSQKSFEELQTNQTGYFEARNRTWIGY